MKLEALIALLKPEAATGPSVGEVGGVVHDSRQVKPGFVFAALCGRHHDGNRFVGNALERGAVAILSEAPPLGGGPPVCWLRVQDARQAMAEAAAAVHGYPADALRMVGITGTNGKSTTAYMVRDMLAAAGQKPGLLGTIRYEMGERIIPASRTTPESTDLQDMLAQMVGAGCQSAVMEVSSHALDQKRVWGIEFDVAVFTNLTHDHLDYHLTEEKYFEAKLQLFLRSGRGRKETTAVINLDDPWGLELNGLPEIRGRRIAYGEHPEALVRAEDIRMGPRGSEARLRTPWGDGLMRLNLLGRFNISNALAALSAGGAMGLELGTMLEVLAGMVAVPGRLEPVPNRRELHVYVDYAHTPDALKNVLTALREVATGRLIVVFGCGGNRDTRKRPLMGAVAAVLADYAIVTSDNPRKENPKDIIAQVLMGVESRKHVEAIEERREAIRRALAVARPGDTVLIAGKGHENYQEFATTVAPFDDGQVAREFLKGDD